MPTVLIVDDEPDVRLVARLVLLSAGYEVLEASSGEEALAAIDGEPRPDAVLLDVRMSGIDGWETMRRLRSRAKLFAVGQIFLFSLTAALNPTLLTATTVMLVLPSPKRLLLGYLLGAYLTSITFLEWFNRAAGFPSPVSSSFRRDMASKGSRTPSSQYGCGCSCS